MRVFCGKFVRKFTTVINRTETTLSSAVKQEGISRAKYSAINISDVPHADKRLSVPYSYPARLK